MKGFLRRRPCSSASYCAIAAIVFLTTISNIGNLTYTFSEVSRSPSTTSVVALRSDSAGLARHQDLEDLEARVRALEKLVTIQNQASPNTQHSNPLLREVERESEQKEQPRNTGTNDARCKMIVADGFNEQINLCQPRDDAGEQGSSLNCGFNKHTKALLCEGKNIVVDRSKVTVSQGGEAIEAVRGRKEDDEYAKYSTGSFSLNCKVDTAKVQNQERVMFHLKAMFNSLEEKAIGTCDIWREKPALFITRYEYANLYHTYTDIFNTYQAIKLLVGDPNTADVDVIFFDGHSQGAMDEFWTVLFDATPEYISNLGDNVCFRKAIFVPPGYTSALGIRTFMDAMRSPSTCYGDPAIAEFADWMVSKFGVQYKGPDPLPTVLLVTRNDYLAHPRMRATRVTRKFKDPAAIQNTLAQAGFIVTVSGLEKISLREQIELFCKHSGVVGMHGAGLSHILVKASQYCIKNSNTGGNKNFLIEIGSSSGRQHFNYFSHTAGLHTYLAMGAAGANSKQEHGVDVVRLGKLLTQLKEELVK